jgi:hypothetical protein
MNIKEPDAVVGILRGILTAEDADDRARRISAFQEAVWEDDGTDPEGPLETILRDLAYDIDYYEGDISKRRESPSFYGEERLRHEVETAIGKLEKCS